jgi:HrpA-like RNA helicase
MPKLKLAATGILDPCGKKPNPFTKKPWPEYYYKYTDNCKKDPFWFTFPTWEDRAQIFKTIHENQIILVTAGTGVGKTFIVPKLFSHYYNYEKGIIMTVPKKTLVEESAGQVSTFLGVPYKLKNPESDEEEETGYKYVGIKHSTEKRFDDTTKILFSTDGSLAVTICKTDPMLKDYNGLMIDEAHERNISIDILLAMCAKICRARPEFKVMIMSATISREMVRDYFTRQGLGKRYGLYNTEAIQIYDKETIFKSPKDVKVADLTEDMMKKIDDLLQNKDGRLDEVFGDDNYAVIDGETKEQYTKYGRDILGFVATETKINTIINYLKEQRETGKYPYRPAFIKLTSKSKQLDKDIAYGASDDGKGLDLYNKEYGEDCKLKVMISTNVAESSVTFKEKLGFVFDTGTSWQVGFDPVRYGTYSREAFTAKANIAQRKGRTGRNCMGRYYPSYSENQWDNEIEEYEAAPITKTDLTDSCLNISLMPDVKNMMGCVGFFNQMLEPIGRVRENLKVAFRNLHDYDMMYKGEITALGHLCSKFGEFSFKTVRMIVCAYHLGGVLIPVLKLASILQCVRGYDDLFNLPVGKTLKEMPKGVQDNIASLKAEYTYPNGEHLSMLFLYDSWLRLPEYQRGYLERYYKLNNKLLHTIEDTYKALAEVVYTNLREIQELRLFQEYENGEKVIPGIHRKQSGGGSRAYGYDENPATDPQNMKDYLMSYKEGDYGFSFQTFNEVDGKDEGIERWGFKPGCLGGHIDRMMGLDRLHKCRGGNGGYPLMKGLLSGGGDKAKGKPSPKGKQQPRKKLSPEELAKKKEMIEAGNKRKEMITKMGTMLKNDEFSMRGMFAQCPERVIDIGDPKQITVDEKVIMCLYFGFCNQIAMKIDTPDSKKYVVKYSAEQGTVKDTMMYKVLGLAPRFVLYHTFMLSDEFDSSLSIVSHIPDRVISLFMREKKKLLDMKLI